MFLLCNKDRLLDKLAHVLTGHSYQPLGKPPLSNSLPRVSMNGKVGISMQQPFGVRSEMNGKVVDKDRNSLQHDQKRVTLALNILGTFNFEGALHSIPLWSRSD